MESEDWHRIGMAGGISALIILVSRYRWIYVGAAAAFIGLRLVASSLFLPSFDAHRPKYFVCGLGCLLFAWLIVRLSSKRAKAISRENRNSVFCIRGVVAGVS
jgi:hypothetical protein